MSEYQRRVSFQFLGGRFETEGVRHHNGVPYLCVSSRPFSSVSSTHMSEDFFLTNGKWDTEIPGNRDTLFDRYGNGVEEILDFLNANPPPAAETMPAQWDDDDDDDDDEE